MCLEFEIPNKMKYRKIEINEEEAEIEPELKKVVEPATISAS
jgi:hypothetical protein